jgi:hypothetical protein
MNITMKALSALAIVTAALAATAMPSSALPNGALANTRIYDLDGTHSRSEIQQACAKAGGTYSDSMGPNQAYGCSNAVTNPNGGTVACDDTGKCVGTCNKCAAIVRGSNTNNPIVQRPVAELAPSSIAQRPVAQSPPSPIAQRPVAELPPNPIAQRPVAQFAFNPILRRPVTHFAAVVNHSVAHFAVRHVR